MQTVPNLSVQSLPLLPLLTILLTVVEGYICRNGVVIYHSYSLVAVLLVKEWCLVSECNVSCSTFIMVFNSLYTLPFFLT